VITGMGVPPFKRAPAIPDHFVLFGEFPEYSADGRPTGWMRAAWVDPANKDGEDFAISGRINASTLTRRLTAEELAALPRRASNGSVLR
jgi:hypothetical protein